MDTQNILNFFMRSEKSLLGVCSRFANKFSLPPIGVRVAFILLTLVFIPLGILSYFGLYILLTKNNKKMITLGLLGTLLGIPLSYYFQSDIVKNYGGTSGVFGYMRNFIKTVERYDKFVGDGGDIVFNLLLSMIVFALIGGGIGYFIDKDKKSKLTKDENL